MRSSLIIPALCGIFALLATPLWAEDPPAPRENGIKALPEAEEAEEAEKAEDEKEPVGLERIGEKLLYTTYFYTAGEAIVHGFADDTSARIISMDRGGTVWQGKINSGRTQHVPTGQGVFSFVADKKASILVGTPSSCTVVGFWLRDADGGFRSDHLFTALPSSAGSSDCRVVVWAWEDLSLNISDSTADEKVASAELKAGTFHEIEHEELNKRKDHILEFDADKSAISVQVYYDEGFFVPSSAGRGAGRLFYTYVGTITEGSNDLNLISYHTTAKVKVTEAVGGKEIFSGEVPQGGIHTINLKGQHVKIESDVEISVLVAPYKHYGAGYAEHHFGVGAEGTGIETRFLLTTPRELWIFSYYAGNTVKVFDAVSDKLVWEGALQRGQVQGVHPGPGYYRVESSRGVSVMGGAANCGAEFSPAAGLFAIDEALFKVVLEIREQRQAAAAAQGQELTETQLNQPLSKEELKYAGDAVKRETGRSDYTDGEVQDRLRSLNTEKQK